MNMEAQPIQTISLSLPEEARLVKEGKVKVEVKREKVEGGPGPLIKLGSGVGAGLDRKDVTKQGNIGFTAAQLHELQLQAMVFGYIAAGRPVPLHLVVSIWNSAVSSSRSKYFCGKYSSSFSSQGLDDRGIMDPEPGRCRRTDGKKWRCTKGAIPEQKYCQQHMHRGRKCSRKLVESSQLASPNGGVPVNSDNGPEKSESLSLQLMTASSRKVSATTIVADINNNSSNNNGTIGYRGFCASNTRIVTAANKSLSSGGNNIDRKNFGSDDGNKSSKFLNSYNITNRRKPNFGGHLAPGMEFSPKSVLQGHCGLPCYKINPEFEAGRCRRTDGKKWRCYNDVLPGEKYCSKHMHRGVKKHKGSSEIVSFPCGVAAATTGYLPCRVATTSQKENSSFETKLAVSLLVNPTFPKCENRSTDSSSTDTTITDNALQGDECDSFSSRVDV